MAIYRSSFLLAVLALAATAAAAVVPTEISPAILKHINKKLSAGMQALPGSAKPRFQAKSEPQSHSLSAPALRSGSGSSKNYMAMYFYTAADCNPDAALLAMLMRAGECWDMEFDGQVASASLVCTPENGLAAYAYQGKGCKDSNLAGSQTLFNATQMGCSSDTNGPIIWDGSSSFSSAMECTNSVTSAFDGSPAIGMYLGDQCDGNWIMAMYVRAAECQQMNATSSFSCGCDNDGMKINSYNDLTCATSVSESTYPTGDCTPMEPSTDDPDAPDVDVLSVGSSYAACSASQLPSDSATIPHATSWSTLAALLLASIYFAAF